MYGLGFGLIDSIALPITKGVSLGWNKLYMIVPMMLYAVSPFIFLKALAGESLTIMNLVWDLSSDVIVTLIGLFVFAEKISPVKLIGVLTGIVSLFLLTYEKREWNGFLAENFRMTGGIFQ
jgi:multidrug transporter EmrE-like cation transporter